MDVRLKTVAGMIQSIVHADVGSDHALLLVALLRSGRIQRGIAIENKRQPLENSRAALRGLAAEVRFSDGVESLHPHEVNSLSVCGMGGERIVTILEAHPERLPSTIVLQPNRRADLVRRWALRAHFRLVDEQIAWGHWPYEIMRLERASSDELHELDPAYAAHDVETALMLGPWLLARREPRLVQRWAEEHAYLSQFTKLEPYASERLRLLKNALDGPADFGSTRGSRRPSTSRPGG